MVYISLLIRVMLLYSIFLKYDSMGNTIGLR